jgi:predicted nucleotidyltransferase
MDKAEAIRCVKQYSNVLKKYFDVKKVVLYGSYANNTARLDSDIDVAVIFNRIEDDFLMTEAKLYRLRRDIDARIEPVLLEESNDISGFMEEILKTGEIIYTSEEAAA